MFTDVLVTTLRGGVANGDDDVLRVLRHVVSKLTAASMSSTMAVLATNMIVSHVARNHLGTRAAPVPVPVASATSSSTADRATTATSSVSSSTSSSTSGVNDATLRVFPESWRATIAADVQRQRVQPHQEPLSSFYLRGVHEVCMI